MIALSLWTWAFSPRPLPLPHLLPPAPPTVPGPRRLRLISLAPAATTNLRSSALSTSLWRLVRLERRPELRPRQTRPGDQARRPSLKLLRWRSTTSSVGRSGCWLPTAAEGTSHVGDIVLLIRRKSVFLPKVFADPPGRMVSRPRVSIPAIALSRSSILVGCATRFRQAS